MFYRQADVIKVILLILWDDNTKHTIQRLPEPPPSEGYDIIIKAMDVFCDTTLPTRYPTAVNRANVIIDIVTIDAYLPTIMITK